MHAGISEKMLPPEARAQDESTGTVHTRNPHSTPFQIKKEGSVVILAATLMDSKSCPVLSKPQHYRLNSLNRQLPKIPLLSISFFSFNIIIIIFYHGKHPPLMLSFFNLFVPFGSLFEATKSPFVDSMTQK